MEQFEPLTVKYRINPMIKTLRITSIILAIAAVVLLILPVVYGVRKNPKMEDFLKKPGVVEKFTTAGSQNQAKNDIEKNPLIAQASGFSTYLNPPPPPPPKTPTGAPVTPANQPPAPPAPVAVKFDLVATSYYAANPEKSFVLIDEAGKGLHWVKQGSTIGHVTIEKVKDGAIVVRDGTRTSEMTVKVKETWRSLLKNPPPSTRTVSTSTSPVTASPAVQAPASPAIQSPVGRQDTESTIPSSPGTARQSPLPASTRRVPRPGLTPPASERITSPAPPVTNTPPQPAPGKVEEPTPAVEQPQTAETAQPAPAPEVAQPQPEEKPVIIEDSPAVKAKAAEIDKLISQMDSSKMTKDEEKKLDEMFKQIEELGKIRETEDAKDANSKDAKK